MDFTNFRANSVDIHHIFPQKYCESKGYDRRKWNSVVNKTPLAYRTNRVLGGVAPSKYLQKIVDNGNVSAQALDANLTSHGIDIASLRADDFDTFFALRARVLLDLISKATGKRITNLNSTEVVDAFGRSLE